MSSSDSVHAGGETELGSLRLTAPVPVVEVVSAVVAARLLPFEQALGLVLDRDALLELSEVVDARVAAVRGDEERIELINAVLSRFKLIVGDTDVVVKE